MTVEILILIIIVIIVVMGFSVIVGAPYIPTRRKWASEALGLVKLNKNDIVVDLGSGDGAILKLVADKGAKVIGYEINPILYLLSRIRTAKYSDRIKIHLKNYWSENLPKDTTVIYIFGLQRDSEKFEKYLASQGIKNLKVITFGFDLPNYKPTKTTNGANLYLFNELML